MKTQEQKIEFANKIDFSGLFHHAEIFAKQKLIFGKPEITERRGNTHINFRSENINLSSCGVFGNILEYCRVESFSNSVYENEDSGKIEYWVDVHISYEHLSGGSNGMALFSARYVDNEWIFEDVHR
jgi:hypothetical protein